MVTINGSGFKPTSRVLFGTKRATFTVVSAQQITAVVPAGAVPSPITVQTPGGTVSTSTNFTPTLSVTSFSPTSGPYGTVVTIIGVGFTNATAVAFNGTAASATKFVSATELKATVPQTATSGVISVSNAAGTASSAKPYTVTPHIAPTVSSFSPTSGPVGTVVTIAGTHFSGASAVKFGTVKAKFKIVSDTQITATVPTGALTAPISVTTAAGTGTSSTSYTVS